MGRKSFAAGLVVLALVVGCSGADEHPLGGPYGGTAGAVNGPTQGAENADTSSDPTGANGNTTSPSSTNPGSPSPTSPTDGGTSPSTHPDASGPSPSPGPSAPTWTSLYTNYLATGTVGDCGSCHGGMRSASGSYAYLKKKGYISGTSSALATKQGSCLSWFGGNMPPSGPASNANASADVIAWAQAGGLQN